MLYNFQFLGWLPLWFFFRLFGCCTEYWRSHKLFALIGDSFIGLVVHRRLCDRSFYHRFRLLDFLCKRIIVLCRLRSTNSFIFGTLYFFHSKGISSGGLALENIWYLKLLRRLIVQFVLCYSWFDSIFLLWRLLNFLRGLLYLLYWFFYLLWNFNRLHFLCWFLNTCNLAGSRFHERVIINRLWGLNLRLFNYGLLFPWIDNWLLRGSSRLLSRFVLDRLFIPGEGCTSCSWYTISIFLLCSDVVIGYGGPKRSFKEINQWNILHFAGAYCSWTVVAIFFSKTDFKLLTDWSAGYSIFFSSTFAGGAFAYPAFFSAGKGFSAGFFSNIAFRFETEGPKSIC